MEQCVSGHGPSQAAAGVSLGGLLLWRVGIGHATLGTMRIDDYKYCFIDQPNGWLGDTVHPELPILVNLRLDPLERTGLSASFKSWHWFKFEFWRLVAVQQEVAKVVMTAIEFPPMQKGASFNLDSVKSKIEAAIKAHQGKYECSEPGRANRACPAYLIIGHPGNGYPL